MIKKSLIYILVIFTAFIIFLNPVKAMTIHNASSNSSEKDSACMVYWVSMTDTHVLGLVEKNYDKTFVVCRNKENCESHCDTACYKVKSYLKTFVGSKANYEEFNNKVKDDFTDYDEKKFYFCTGEIGATPDEVLKDGIEYDNTVVTPSKERVIGWGKIPLKKGLFLITDNKCTVGDDCPTCEDLITEKGGELLQTIFNIIKILAVVALFGLTTLDFVKGVASDEENYYRKALATLGKRIVVVIAIFLLPTLIKLIMAFIGIESGACGIE